ncbi:restriction endonuclease [Diaphorobacter aerolatus]|uniref:restriction endonuclease n=1 Tax=Diaphorobacter aerolatus TaxID=1288495 RepID=UPI00299F59A1|nr:restriction endonuclease [Diaphorobacter aerolatus]
MAENSLFAILLRSPWWISFAISAAIVTACLAWLPRDIAPFAALGAAPIFVIGCMAAWRQFKAPSGAKVEAIRAEAAAMSWKDFCAALENAWKNEGQSVQRVAGQTAAVDLQLEKNGTLTLVSARRWKAANHGLESLKELSDAVQRLKADHGVYVVLQGSVSDSARAMPRSTACCCSKVTRLPPCC